jgi:hypothetical protein
MFWVGEVPISKAKVVYSGNVMAQMGEEGLLAFNVYKGMPHIVNEFDGYGFIILRTLCRDVVSCEYTYCVPLC